jgi:tetratricopeptide (TPR) repeat protein
MRPIVLFLGLCGLIGGISAAAAETQQSTQSTSGACSPAILGNNNKVICNDIDARALKRLNDELDAKDLTIAQKIKEAEEWARKYSELDRQLTEARSQAAAKGADATLLKTAQDLLHEGKLEEAGKIYDQLLSHAEPDVDRAAQYHFSRAQIYALQFRPLDALPHYAKAYQYRPDRLEYANEYAFTLIGQKEYKKAEFVCDNSLSQLGGLAAQNPAAYRPDLVATILTNLGIVYADTQRFGDAESAYKVALDIRRGLAAQNPAAYRPDLAGTLTNLGIVYHKTQRFGDAESAYKEALDIQRGLAAQNPAAYRPDLAGTLTNLVKLYRETHQSAEAKAAEDEILKNISK